MDALELQREIRTAQGVARVAAQLLRGTLHRNTGELPTDEQARYDEWVGRAAAFEAALEYAIKTLEQLAGAAEPFPGLDDLEDVA